MRARRSGFVNIEIQIFIAVLGVGVALLIPVIRDGLIIYADEAGIVGGLLASARAHWLSTLAGGALILYPFGVILGDLLRSRSD